MHEFALWSCIVEIPVDCRKTLYRYVRNGSFKNLLGAFVFGGCSLLVVKQAELHLMERVVGQQLD